MTEYARCPDCGAELPTGATAGLCPRCLLAGAWESSDEASAVSPYAATTPQSGGFVPPVAAALAPDFPQLEILEILGHGGMGAVYKARQSKLDRIVALKIIRPESADDPAFAERFTREARTLARLSHPNIVAIHDFGETSVRNDPLQRAGAGSDPLQRVGGDVHQPAHGDRMNAITTNLFYFVMEYIDGASLRELMQAGPLQPAQALAIVPQICDALQYAHDEGIIHRDIKPENILVDRRGRVKIADFGLAKLAAQSAENFTLTGTHQVMGTPRYMAPEQMEGSRLVDHRADIYSLGVVFYEMLTGELPLGRFEAPSRKAAVDARLDEVVYRALAKEPSQRYQRASEIRRDVDAVVLDALSQGGAESLAGEGSIAAGYPGPSTILERQVAGVVNWVRGKEFAPAAERPAQLSESDRSAIRRQVRAPGLALILYGLVLLLPAALLFTNGFDAASAKHAVPWFVGVAMMIGSLCLVAVCGLLIRGGWHLLSLEGLRPALLASILGQPIGIWPLVVLSRPDVKAAFATPSHSSSGPFAIRFWNTTTWEALACIGATAATFLPWGRIAGNPGAAPGTEFTAAGLEWPHDGVPPAASAVVLLVLLLATAAVRPKPVWRSMIMMGVAAIWLACSIHFVVSMQGGSLHVSPLLDAANWHILHNGHRVGTVYEARSMAAIFTGSGPYWLMALAVALMSAAAIDLGRTLRGRAAATTSRELGPDRTQNRAVAPIPSQSPVARVGFTVPRHDELGAHIKFHFGELGYRLVRETADGWVFERGRKSAAFLESDIRAYHAKLTVRSLPLGDAGQRVSCTWVVATLGLAHISRRDIAALEAEGRELEALLQPSGTHTARSGQISAATVRAPGNSVRDTSVMPVANAAPTVPNLDLHRIQMELRGPAGGLFIVALLSAIFWCVNGAMLLYDGFYRGGQWRAEPAEVLGAAGAAAALLFATAVLIYGARHLRRVTGYEWCIAAAILAMVPWSAAALVGLPVGIWTFRTLRRPDVRDAFLKRSLESESKRRRPVAGGGRNWVTVSREQAENDRLPDICMVCGEPARERVNKTFHHEPDWAGMLLFAGVIPGLIALAFTTRTMRVACPVCLEHRTHWSRLNWVAGAGWLLILLAGAVGYVGGMIAFPEGTAMDDKHRVFGMIAGASAGFLLWLAPVIYLACTRVGAKKITLRDITFERVAPEFAREAASLAADSRSVSDGTTDP